MTTIIKLSADLINLNQTDLYYYHIFIQNGTDNSKYICNMELCILD